MCVNGGILEKEGHNSREKKQVYCLALELKITSKNGMEFK